jgi:hypothetical protein
LVVLFHGDQYAHTALAFPTASKVDRHGHDKGPGVRTRQ